MVRAEADVFIAASTHEECVVVRRALKEDECADEGDGGQFFFDLEKFFAFCFAYFTVLTPYTMGTER